MATRKTTWTLACIAFVLAALFVLAATLNRCGPRDHPVSDSAETTIEFLRLASQLYHIDCGSYPHPETWMDDLLVDPGIEGWRGPYLEKAYTDPWGNEIRCDLVGGRPRFRSLGRDRVFGTEDDVVVGDGKEREGEEWGSSQ